MVISLLLAAIAGGWLPAVGDGPEYVIVPAGHQTVYEGTARQCITQDGKENVLEGEIRVLQIVLDELADGTRQIVRVVTKKTKDGPAVTVPQVFTIDSSLGMGKAWLAAATLSSSPLPDLPQIIDLPLSMEQVELEEGETKERHLQVYGQPVKAVSFEIEALDSDLYQVTASPADKLPVEIMEGQQLTDYAETFTVDPLEERVVGYKLDWSLDFGEGTVRFAVDVEETSDSEVSDADLVRLTKGAHQLQKVQEATYTDPDKAEKLLAALEVDVKGTALMAAAKGLRRNIGEYRQFQEQQAREEKLVAQMMNKPAPDFTLESLAGEKVTFSEFTKGKLTLLSFWGYG